MSRRTPWTQSGSLTSDRLNPKPRKKREATRNIAATTTKPSQTPKSPAVRALESTIRTLKTKPGTESNPLGGCFCQARSHSIAPNVPICSRCGLILCELNPPYFACPHCASPLLTEPSKASLLAILSTKLGETLREETDAAERALEEARVAEGAFPLLGSSIETPGSSRQEQQQQHVSNAGNAGKTSSPIKPKGPHTSHASHGAQGGQGQSMRQPSQEPTTHKVLSLNAKTKRVTVASYGPSPSLSVSATSTPATSGSATPLESSDVEAAPRVPPPPTDLVCALSDKGAERPRPWADIRNDGFACVVSYVPDAVKKLKKK